MKKTIILIAMLMAFVVAFAGVDAPTTTIGRTVNGMTVFTNSWTATAADSANNAAVYGSGLPSGTFDGNRLCGKYVTFQCAVTTSVVVKTKGATNGSTYTYMFPRLYGSIDGTTWVLIGTYNYTYSTNRTAGTVFSFVANLTQVRYPYLQVRYYVATTGYAEANSASTISAGAIKVSAISK
jgi:hypothetical protein